MNYYVKKLISFVLTLFCVALLSFFLFQIIPGDAAVSKLGTDATAEQIAELRAEYGYDQNIVVRFFSWLGGVFTGDLGVSIKYGPITVSELIGQRLPVTLWLGLLSILMITVLSIPIGLICAKKPGGIVDKVSDWISLVFMAVPSFVQGILITLLFGIILNLFVPGRYTSPGDGFREFIQGLFFPALAVAIPKIAMTVKFMKTSVKKELKLDYVRTAKAKGNSQNGIMWKHVLKNSLLPVITFIGLIVAEVMAGSIMVEKVFNLPGLGLLLVNSIANRDFNVVQAIVMYIAIIVITVNFLVDIIYKLIDPRT
ncbi:MAG: ABC transporter permease [Lachnospiraceae bacterium]|nr:ABC transporter permease [Lachnospiraceae bacterium]